VFSKNLLCADDDCLRAYACGCDDQNRDKLSGAQQQYETLHNQVINDLRVIWDTRYTMMDPIFVDVSAVPIGCTTKTIIFCTELNASDAEIWIHCESF